MAKKKQNTTGDGAAWLVLLLCLGFVAFSVYHARDHSPTSDTPKGTEPTETTQVHMQWADSDGLFSDDLFAPITEAPPTEPTTAPTTVAPTEAPTTISPTEPIGFSKDDPLLVLVNRDHPYEPSSPPALSNWKNSGIQVASVAYDALVAMLSAGEQQGLNFVVCSGYRSKELQEQLFNEDVDLRMSWGQSYEEAWANTALFTMPPGCSEHNTGLALDIVSLHNQHLDSTQEQTKETQWLQAHCWEYGFILRYPKDKRDVTGISYESWHYRYVGKAAAKYLTENSLTLEEYHAQQS
ncbi:MAG: M15 family metallopeptidase [Oscillospiraceae bacterium]|nr:M15 family metallopeptidase [Oscillospiraceae bacterium]